jgi:hypothetical protein
VKGKVLKSKGRAVDEVTLVKLERLVSFAQERNNALQAELTAKEERIAVLEAKLAIAAAELAGSRQAVEFLKYRLGEEQEGGCEGCVWSGADWVDGQTGEVSRGCCLRNYE